MKHSCLMILLIPTFLSTVCTAAEPVDFAREIQPLLAQKCLICHGPDEQEGGLRLDVRESILKLLDSKERAVVPGHAKKSELIHRITTDDPDLKMPPKGDPLTPGEIQKLTDWINQGAAFSVHWAYRPLWKGELPQADEWVRNPIDHFVLEKLTEHNLAPSPEAKPELLIRRLSLDLLGLSPTIAEVDQFLNDSSPNAYEKLVDRMLASKHFGERWGRHWLDKARYADSDGYEKDRPRPNAWKYRDWVIQAINNDLPFDQFTVQQLAGDLLPEATEEIKLATAFHRQTLTNTEGGTDQEQWRVAAVMDRTETLGQIWLGLSVGCARCHNHKYDQISQQEYYQLYAYFNNGDETNMNLLVEPERLEAYQKELKVHQQQVKELQGKIAELKKAKKPTKDLDAELKKLTSKAPKSPYLPIRIINQRTSSPRTTHILHRGEFKQPREAVQPGTFESLPGFGEGEKPAEKSEPKTRLELARWLVNGKNPLVQRVVVNQIWIHLFGTGIVQTPTDFGVRGETPTHPKLLDWLAQSYVDLGWSRKKLIKQIVMSATYRQSSQLRPELEQQDPNNQLLARQNRFRVEAETVRDLALSSSGLLSRKTGGPSVFPPMPADVAALSYANNFRWNTSKGEDRYRRGMYTFFKRTSPHPTLITFDCPDSNVTCIERNRSNTPLAALLLLNNAVFLEAAQALAKEVLTEAKQSDVQRLTMGCRKCWSRSPDSDELEFLTNYLEKCRTYYGAHPEEATKLMTAHTAEKVAPAENAAWVLTMRLLMNVDEFITRE